MLISSSMIGPGDTRCLVSPAQDRSFGSQKKNNRHVKFKDLPLISFDVVQVQQLNCATQVFWHPNSGSATPTGDEATICDNTYGRFLGVDRCR